MSLVVFVGTATLDAIALMSRFPEPDERRVADEIVYAGGGPAATAAVTAAGLGVPAAFVGTVGDDEEGSRIVAGLRAEGVDTSAVTVDADRPSGVSVAIVDGGKGTRAICNRPAPAVDLTPAADLLESASWMHVDHLGWAPGHRYLQRLPAGRRPLLSVDAGNPIAGFTASRAELFVPTEAALRHHYGEGPLDTLLRAALADGAATVVATRGAQGSVGATADGTHCAVSGYAVETVSTLGAGDVFHGALVAALVRGLPLGRAMSYAGIAAALSCRAVDGRSAIPEHSEILARLAELKEEE